MSRPIRCVVTPMTAPPIAQLIRLLLGPRSLIISTLVAGAAIGPERYGRCLETVSCYWHPDRPALRLDLIDDCVPLLRFALPLDHARPWPIQLGRGLVTFPDPRQLWTGAAEHPWIELRSVPVVSRPITMEAPQ